MIVLMKMTINILIPKKNKTKKIKIMMMTRKFKLILQQLNQLQEDNIKETFHLLKMNNMVAHMDHVEENLSVLIF